MKKIQRTVILLVAILAIAFADIDLTKLPKRVWKKRSVDESFFREREITFPPKFTQQPDKEIAYKVGDTVTGVTKLPCVAQGDPEPEYHWEKNGKQLEIEGVSYKKQVGEGTLIIEDPQDDHEGIYQCFAKNQHGTAVSVKTRLRKAMLEPFDSVQEAYVHHPEIGSYLVLRCHPPKSYPAGSVYWGISRPGDKFTSIPESDRVSLDYDGNLHISNVKMIDYNEGKNYMCIVNNNHLRGLVQGDDAKIQPKAATPPYKAPMLVWSSPTTTVGLHGLQHKMKCIFSGFPTPKVKWERIDGEIDPNRVNPNKNFGLELEFEPLDFKDNGTYRCSASNKDGEFVTQMFTLKVESMPYWVREMENVNTAEEEDAEFECHPGGSPPPSVSWTIDGTPIEQMDGDDRRTLQRNKLIYRNVTKADSQVIQCNATNKHGYIFANAYLNVLAEPPTFIQSPQPVTKKAVGQDATITCRVFGAPNPKITWFFDDQEINNPRFSVNKDGDLEIKSVAEADRGDYKCLAENKFGNIDAQGTLIVRQRTLITVFPENKDVNASTDVVFECGATTDPLEAANLKITWRRDSKPIDFSNEPRMRLNVRNNELTIIAATVADTADYTCVADNGLDKDEVTATLSVKDRPSPPYNVKVKNCRSTDAVIEWVSGNENGEPIIEIILYYNTSFDKPGEFKEAQRVPRGRKEAAINISPWANYTFHLRARNSLGASDPSEFTTVCVTPPDKPFSHPTNVCAKSVDPNKLVITWDPMDQIDHNGRGFHYIVGYKRNVDGEEEKTEKVFDWRQRQFVIEGTETFQEYIIYVKSANELGECRTRINEMIGYSGEGVPEVTPDGLAIDDTSLNATSAIFFWDSVDTRAEVMKGLFTGYEIHYWKQDDPENIKVHQIPRESGEFCRPLGSDRPGGGDNPGRTKRQAGSETTHILDLWPYSQISAAILARNSQQKGKLSDPPITINTPEGVPSRVPSFAVTKRASHHLEVSWEPPLEPNGVLLGYELGYREEADSSSPMQTIPILDPLKRSQKIKNLTPDTVYYLTLRAKTGAGFGEEQVADGTTVTDLPPDVPGFSDIEIGDDSLNVSFVPSQSGKEKNPGSDFYVEYREVGSDDWIRSDPEEDEYHTNITGLTTGALYEIVVVAVNGNGEETRSPPKKVRVGPHQDESVQQIATAGWFVGMMCAIIFLLLILLIVCLIKRNRGGKYPVHEKEKLRGRDPEKDDEEGGFGEYTKTPNSKVPYMELKSDEPDYKKSAGSLESETKPLGESDEDSMLEYEETDPTKFNEDGSFIGQYGGKTKKEEKMEPDATSPSALSTFV